MHRVIRLAVGCALALSVAGSLAAADMQTISRGQEVVLEDHLVPEKYVLFDFYADWCGPCRALEPHIAERAAAHADRLAVRKIDIVNWDSAVARQHRLSSIPHLRLFGPDGVLVAAGDAGSVLNRLDAALGGAPLSPASRAPSPVVPLAAVAAIFAVAAALLVRRRVDRPQNTQTAAAARVPKPIDTAARPGDPAIWFTVVQGRVEGPLTRGQLAELVRRKVLAPSSEVRRTGEVDWSTIEHVLD